MRRLLRRGSALDVLRLGAALVLLAPAVGRTQEPPPAPITATPLLPPSMQYPSPGGSSATGAQPMQPQPGVIVQPGVGQQGAGGLAPGQPLMPQPGQPQGLPQVQPPAQAGQGQTLSPPGAPLSGQPGAPLTPPLQGAAPGQALAPGQGVQGQGVQGQGVPGQTVPGQAVPGQPSAQGQPTGPQPAPPPPNIWVPQAGAVLQALDKINAQTTTLTVKDGQTVTFGSLSITVKACLVRPPDMPRNATAYLTIVDSHPNQPGFQGWMVASDPSLSMLEHPLYDVRVTGCLP